MNHTKKRSSAFLLFAIIYLSGFDLPAQNITQSEADSYLKNLPFEMKPVILPVFPEKYFDITKYGAVPDGLTKNTEAIQNAIDDCAAGGGGYVIVPSGYWLTGPIRLRSNINLHLEKGAMIVFSADHKDFPLIQAPGSDEYELMTPIYGYKIENAAVTGDGLFDGNGDSWRPVKRSKMTVAQWKKLTGSGVVNKNGDMWWPSEQAMNAEEFLSKRKKNDLTKDDYENIRDYLRPYMLYIEKSKNILIDNISLQNSPKFAMNLRKCENVIVRQVKVMNDWWAQNGDGLDISSSKNVLMYRCTVNAGDDGICIKSSGKSKDGNPEMENIVIADCVVYQGHGGFVIGSNTDGGIRNVAVRNCNFAGTDTGLRFKSGIGRGGLVENIFIDNIMMKGIQNEAIIFDLYYEDKGAARTLDAAIDSKRPLFRKIYINRVICDGAAQALFVNDLPECSVMEIAITNSTIIALGGFKLSGGKNITLGNVIVKSKSSPLFDLTNSLGITLEKFVSEEPGGLFMKLSGDKTGGITLDNSNPAGYQKMFEFTEGASENSVQVR
jgi:DNA sulfur modification protein DndE